MFTHSDLQLRMSTKGIISFHLLLANLTLGRKHIQYHHYREAKQPFTNPAFPHHLKTHRQTCLPHQKKCSPQQPNSYPAEMPHHGIASSKMAIMTHRYYLLLQTPHQRLLILQ